MSTRTKKLAITFEQAYIKTICRVQRETVGFLPTITQRNRKKYNRADAKRELRRNEKY